MKNKLYITLKHKENKEKTIISNGVFHADLLLKLMMISKGKFDIDFLIGLMVDKGFIVNNRKVSNFR